MRECEYLAGTEGLCMKCLILLWFRIFEGQLRMDHSAWRLITVSVVRAACLLISVDLLESTNGDCTEYVSHSPSGDWILRVGIGFYNKR